MDAKTRRMMKTKQGRVSASIGSPDTSGYEGQVEVREVNGSPVLFARLNNRWIQSPLLTGGAFFIPKAYTANVVLPLSGAKSFHRLPQSIPLDNIMLMSVVAKQASGGKHNIQLPATDQGLTSLNSQMLLVDASSRLVYMAQDFSSAMGGLNARLTVLYK